jgi:hypothetical protein
MLSHVKNVRMRLVVTVAAGVLLAGCGSGARPPDAAPRAASAAATTAAAQTAGAGAASTPRAATGSTTPAATARAGLRIEALLQPQGPTVEATVRIEAATSSAPADLIVTAKVTKPGVFPIHLHGGTCRAPSASVGFLGTLVPGQEGRATFQTSGVALPGGTSVLTFELLERNEVVIDIHDPAGAVVACAELRRGGQQ